MEAVLSHRLEQTYREQRTGLLRFITSRISNREDAEDILQEVFFQALRSLDVTEPIGNLAGWLYTVARNRIIDWYRRKRPGTVSLTAADERTGFEDLLLDSGLRVEQDVIRTLAVDALIDGIEALPERQREVIVLQAIEGRTFAEIAELTGAPINTLIARKRYALQALRKRLTDLGEILADMAH